MTNVLDKIVEDKRIEVAQREIDFPLSHFRAGLTSSQKSLFNALNKKDAGFIFECKKASPSKGLIREHFDLDEILEAYLPYAAGISVLTDEKYFQGKYEYLEYVTQRANVPVLNKDFFVSSYQVYLARYYQADAVLLMLSVLDDNQYKALAEVADALSLDILTEVSNKQEMHRAIALKAKIIGINNRDLRDLSTNLATTERLIPLLERATHDYVVISESGIYTHNDVQRLAAVSHGFLVGSALMAQQDLKRAVKSLIFGETKVCGITRSEDATAALKAGASFLGLIFAEQSPRYISTVSAQKIMRENPAPYVGVFVNASVEHVFETATSLQLFAVQLHSNESPQFRQSLRQLFAAKGVNIKIWQAAPLSQNPEPEQIHHAQVLLRDPTCDKVLVDCKVGNQSGGTGHSFKWSILAHFSELHNVVLAGGIGEHNIALASTYPVDIIDINSAVETAPGIKDHTAISRVIHARRCEAAHSLTGTQTDMKAG